MHHALYVIMSAEAVKAMKGNRGRMVVQAAHGYVHSLWDAANRFPNDHLLYQKQTSAFKMALVVPDETALRALYDAYRPICGVSMVEESGSRSDGTVNDEVRAVTALGIGPIRSDLIGADLKSLKPFL